MHVAAINKLPRAKTPEEVGVSSNAVISMIKDIEESGAEEHGFMIIRHGKIAAESFKYPYSADSTHIMYSASKPVTSTAVGFAVNEGFLSLDTKVLDIFPEFRPRKIDKKLEKVTIKYLMTMKAGKMPNLLANKTKDKWLNHFFDGKWIFEPGESWEYINENIFLLCAILVRVTGLSVSEFLKPRLWEPLGIESYYWETDPKGVESGGWGLFLSPENLAKFSLCYLQGGVFNGLQVIPAEWAKAAVLNHKNCKDDEEPNEDGGYGYGFWRNGPDRKSYRVEGMFSETSIVFDDYDAIVLTVGGEIDAGRTHQYIFNNFPNGFIQDDTTAELNPELKKAIAARVCAP
ncbi:MAG: serine hydrolase, partial [Eubacteriales bacterium]